MTRPDMKGFFVCCACGSVRPDYEVQMGSDRYPVLCRQCTARHTYLVPGSPLPNGGYAAVPFSEASHG